MPRGRVAGPSTSPTSRYTHAPAEVNRPSRVRAVILENGVIRTLDPALPLGRALAIAGDRVAGAVGTHEMSLPSPETVDLEGRCVLPGFTDSHVHFPSWTIAQRQLRLEGAASV